MQVASRKFAQSRAEPTRFAMAAGLVAWIALSLPMTAPGQETESSAPPMPAADAASPDTQPAEPLETASARRDAAQATFNRLMEEERYDEAAVIAGEMVDLTARAYGEKSIERSMALTNLAAAQMRRGDLAAAETGYGASIAIIEMREGVSSTRLIDPLVGLAETHMKGGSYEEANAAYRWALQVNHADLGFYNPEQARILDGLAESYLAAGKVMQASAQQRIQVAIERRRLGPDSPDVVPALYKLGRWYNRTGQYVLAHEAYQDARRIIRESKGNDDPALVDGLLGEAIIFENEGEVAKSASMMKRALDLLDAQPERDHLKRAEVLVALGDLYVVTSQPRSARERYAQAWQELSGDDSLIAERDRYFAEPSRISGPPLPKLIGTDGQGMAGWAGDTSSLAPGLVLASLTVDANGEARNTRIIESDPPGLLDKRVLAALDYTAFRPKMADGATVASEGVQFRHEFRYPRAAATESSPPPAREAAGEPGQRIGYPDTRNDSDDEPGP
jgi:tetratricopeptide (TPR) repeat protein